MKKKATVNYIVDIVIAVAFIISLVTGIALLFIPQGGYMGGRNPAFQETILFLSMKAWKDLHIWSSIMMAAGVLGHLVLHWKWIVCMTKSLFTKKRGQECPV
jgi:cytochrome b subunit of formate dehydrogenase